MARWRILAIAIPWLAAGAAYGMQVVDVQKHPCTLARLLFSQIKRILHVYTRT